MTASDTQVGRILTGTTEAFVSPVVDRSVGEQVTVEIRRAILSGSLRPGQLLECRRSNDDNAVAVPAGPM